MRIQTWYCSQCSCIWEIREMLLLSFCSVDWLSAASCSLSLSFSFLIFSIACRCRLMMFWRGGGGRSFVKNRVCGVDGRWEMPLLEIFMQVHDIMSICIRIRASEQALGFFHGRVDIQVHALIDISALLLLLSSSPPPPSPGTPRCTSGGPSPSCGSCGAAAQVPFPCLRLQAVKATLSAPYFPFSYSKRQLVLPSRYTPAMPASP
jgi:hypothetical protein